MWIESHQSLRDHPKKDRLAELLFNGAVPVDVADFAAIGLLHELWWWALDYAPDGDLSRFTDRQIAKGCRWYGDAELLVKALGEAHFIDRKTRRIHDWDEYAGKLLAKREADRERMARNRRDLQHVRERFANGSRTVREQSQDRRANVAGTNLPTYLKRDRRPVDNSKPVDNSRKPDARCPICRKKLSPAELADETATASDGKTWWHLACKRKGDA